MLPTVIGPRVLVRRETVKTQSSDIIVVEFNEKVSQFAEVVAVGTGAVQRNGSRRPPVVSPGDRVLLTKFNGSPIDIAGETLFFVMEEDVIAVVSP